MQTGSAPQRSTSPTTIMVTITSLASARAMVLHKHLIFNPLEMVSGELGMVIPSTLMLVGHEKPGDSIHSPPSLKQEIMDKVNNLYARLIR